ncbi:hypothetical protein LZ30DRAFT_111897 [Colletotrichum cereale]|nr:hypothetical protein LZ30DRAFT_111897 [Colletotrichum cereale]
MFSCQASTALQSSNHLQPPPSRVPKDSTTPRKPQNEYHILPGLLPSNQLVDRWDKLSRLVEIRTTLGHTSPCLSLAMLPPGRVTDLWLGNALTHTQYTHTHIHTATHTHSYLRAHTPSCNTPSHPHITKSQMKRATRIHASDNRGGRGSTVMQIGKYRRTATPSRFRTHCDSSANRPGCCSLPPPANFPSTFPNVDVLRRFLFLRPTEFAFSSSSSSAGSTRYPYHGRNSFLLPVACCLTLCLFPCGGTGSLVCLAQRPRARQDPRNVGNSPRESQPTHSWCMWALTECSLGLHVSPPPPPRTTLDDRPPNPKDRKAHNGRLLGGPESSL